MADVLAPDPARPGGPEWLAATGGCLTGAQRRRMYLTSAQVQLRYVVEHLRRRARCDVDLSSATRPPRTALTTAAEEAAEAQGPELLAHAYRTAIFSRALALVDGADVDHELLHAAALLHDVGLVEPVPGQDFTRRSADVALACAHGAGPAERGQLLEDAIVVHTTIGISPEVDGSLGCYLQWGAMVDLVGLRERDLPHELVSSAVERHPRTGFARVLRTALRSEARAVPCGRFALLRRTGFPLVLSAARVPSRP